jgi:hypothetical protein
MTPQGLSDRKPLGRRSSTATNAVEMRLVSLYLRKTRALSSAGEHYVDIVGVGGSIPPAPTSFPHVIESATTDRKGLRGPVILTGDYPSGMPWAAATRAAGADVPAVRSGCVRTIARLSRITGSRPTRTIASAAVDASAKRSSAAKR